jgi:hypothetical protein
VGLERGDDAVTDGVTEQRLRELYAQAVAARSTRRGADDHPALEAIHALARREGEEAARLATLDHVMSCGSCRAELDLVRTIEAAGARAGGAPAARPARRSWLVPSALAATVLLALGIGLGRGRLASGGGDGDDVVRDLPGAAGVTLLAPAASAPAGRPVTFVWHPVAGAVRYQLEVLTPGGEVVLASATADTTVASADAARLAPGDYRWWVRAATADGAAPRSALRPLRLIAR